MNTKFHKSKSPVSIKIVGLILSESYQKCKIFAQKLRRHYSKRFLEPAIRGYLEMDWVEYLGKLQRDVGGQTWAVKKGAVVFINGVFIGGEKELFDRLSGYAYLPPSSERIKEIAKEEYTHYLNRNNLLYTFFELSLDGEYMGSLLFELRPDLLPKTAMWFATLSDPNNRIGFSYKNSRIHRVCRRGWFQGGKLGLAHSAGYLEDESLCYKHDRRGVLSLAKWGKDLNRCQYFVTFKPSEWMDEYYVGFGRVVEGSDVLRRLENTKCTYEYPDHDIRVANCGLADVGWGRRLGFTTRLKMKGLTVGEPHLDLEMFKNILMDWFAEALFERLDVEVKRQIHGKWIREVLWDEVKQTLGAREPVADCLDVNDRSSQVFIMSNYLKGLYDFQEIPDHYIIKLLNQVVDNVVDQSDTIRMASSVVNSLIDALSLEGRSSGEGVAESLIRQLMKTIDDIILRAESSDLNPDASASSLKKELFQRSIEKVASQNKVLSKRLEEKSHSTIGGKEQKDGDVDHISTKESVVGFILETLLESFKTTAP